MQVWGRPLHDKVPIFYGRGPKAVRIPGSLRNPAGAENPGVIELSADLKGQPRQDRSPIPMAGDPKVCRSSLLLSDPASAADWRGALPRACRPG